MTIAGRILTLSLPALAVLAILGLKHTDAYALDARTYAGYLAGRWSSPLAIATTTATAVCAMLVVIGLGLLLANTRSRLLSAAGAVLGLAGAVMMLVSAGSAVVHAQGAIRHIADGDFNRFALSHAARGTSAVWLSFGGAVLLTLAFLLIGVGIARTPGLNKGDGALLALSGPFLFVGGFTLHMMPTMGAFLVAAAGIGLLATASRIGTLPPAAARPGTDASAAAEPAPADSSAASSSAGSSSTRSDSADSSSSGSQSAADAGRSASAAGPEAVAVGATGRSNAAAAAHGTTPVTSANGTPAGGSASANGVAAASRSASANGVAAASGGAAASGAASASGGASANGGAAAGGSASANGGAATSGGVGGNGNAPTNGSSSVGDGEGRGGRTHGAHAQTHDGVAERPGGTDADRRRPLGRLSRSISTAWQGSRNKPKQAGTPRASDKGGNARPGGSGTRSPNASPGDDRDRSGNARGASPKDEGRNRNTR